MSDVAGDARSYPADAARVGIVGRGKLYEAALGLLARAHQVVPLPCAEPDPATVEDLDVVLLADDGREHELHQRWNDLCRAQRIPLLPVSVEPGAAIVGPVVLADEAGCLRCVEVRRMRARGDRADYTRLVEEFGAEVSALGSMWLTSFATTCLSDLAAREIARILGGTEEPTTRRAFVRLALDGLRSSVHRFLPDPLCERCGDAPEDTRDAAVIEPKPRPTTSPGSYRVRSLGGEKQRLMELYVDERAGLLRAVHKDGNNIFPHASAPMGLRAGRVERGFGRQSNYHGSELTAIAEGLERYGGIEPGGKRTVVRASYNELGQDALDPISLGLHSDEQYDRPAFPYVRYHGNLVFNWVWGYSFRTRRPVLVPENYAYYGTLYKNTRDQPFVYEISNGCAIGGCLEEAILCGILEVAERDAFLMTWYARMGVPRIDPASARDPSVALIVEGIEGASGYRVEAFNTTLEHGVPCFWVMAIDQHAQPDMPAVLCAAGSHFNPEKALINALMELASFVSRPAEYYRDNRERVQKMLVDPDAVVAMEDHSLLNGAPEAIERFDFLRRTTGVQSFRTAFEDFYRSPASEDLLDDLNDTVGRYLGTGLDVVVVDQTTPEHLAGDFRCVKVIIPGMLPMTFGNYARRTTGFERLYQLAHQLGYSDRPLTDADVNPYPHPFP